MGGEISGDNLVSFVYKSIKEGDFAKAIELIRKEHDERISRLKDSFRIGAMNRLVAEFCSCASADEHDYEKAGFHMQLLRNLTDPSTSLNLIDGTLAFGQPERERNFYVDCGGSGTSSLDVLLPSQIQGEGSVLETWFIQNGVCSPDMLRHSWAAVLATASSIDRLMRRGESIDSKSANKYRCVQHSIVLIDFYHVVLSGMIYQEAARFAQALIETYQKVKLADN